MKRLIVKKIISNGFLWTLRRVFQEFKSPSYNGSRWLLDYFYSIKKNIFHFIAIRRRVKTSHLIAIYDTDAGAAITYDFAHFIASAESFAIENGERCFSVVVIKKNYDKQIEEGVYGKIIDKYSSSWRLDNIIVPLILLYPACVSYHIFGNKNDLVDLIKGHTVYPKLYDGSYCPTMDYREVFRLLNKNEFTGFHASKQGIRYVQLWLESRSFSPMSIVTIVLRNYGFDSVRNSNIDEWIKFYEWVSVEGYNPVFILDTDASFINDDRFNGLNVFREGCWNLGLRMALYQLSYLVFDSQGTGSIAQLSRNVRYIRNNLMIEDSLETTSKQWEDKGVSVGQKRFDFASELQLLSWKIDSFENIRNDFIHFSEVASGKNTILVTVQTPVH
jgi:hypothetical protein